MAEIGGVRAMILEENSLASALCGLLMTQAKN